MTFAVSGSAVSASPIGQALQIHPKPQSKESANFELSEIKQIFQKYFKDMQDDWIEIMGRTVIQIKGD